jgi:hypothetical protein
MLEPELRSQLGGTDAPKGIEAGKESFTPMPRLLLIALLFLFTSALAEPTAFFEGSLQVEVPESLRALDQPAIDAMFAGAKSQPGVVLATPDSETRVSITHAAAPLTVEELEDTKAALKARVDGQASDITWVRDEMVTLNGTPWFRLDYDLGATEEAKRETILGTSLDGRLLFMVIATPLEDLELMQEELQSLIGSLRLTQITGTEH